ncbi:DUF3306 domain-containing protein [Shimia abyssi]|uniref:Uncharacterized protein DUF3306 n=1 Tax=Shimia abyssi TaxID=1662395 RepID=A0A2P8FAI0_9RHOB|nr:DUF3306 domain-containing protein [Shimia abyssi]PSL18714.1 uncharacterized protein DUF3306 [Shimia abyssi]
MTQAPATKPRDFWARRKAAVAAEAEAETIATEQAELAETHTALEEKTDAEILSDLELPDPDTLEQGDDFSVFLAKAVPERIRRRALRKLWLSNPVLANVDALVDYGEDYTDSATVIEGMQTAYQVGKGMLKHIEEMARQAELEANPPEPDLKDADDTHDLTLAQSEDDAREPMMDACDPPAAAPMDTVADHDTDTDQEPVALQRRRLRFAFDDTQANSSPTATETS